MSVHQCVITVALSGVSVGIILVTMIFNQGHIPPLNYCLINAHATSFDKAGDRLVNSQKPLTAILKSGWSTVIHLPAVLQSDW